MISLEPFILTGEIVQQVVAIVLVGIVIVELMRHRRRVVPHVRRNLSLILVAIFISTISSVMDYFMSNGDPAFYLFMYMPIAFAMPILFWIAIRNTRTISLMALFSALFIVEAAIIGICLMHIVLGIDGPAFDTIRVTGGVAETFVLYFLVLAYCMRISQNESRTA